MKYWFLCLSILFLACSNSKPYAPKSREELVKLLNNPEIKLSEIETKNVQDMSFLFARIQDCQAFVKNDPNKQKKCENSARHRQDFEGIQEWNVSNVLEMNAMFAMVEDFNLSLESWNVEKVQNMQQMFYGAKNFNQTLQMWKVSDSVSTEMMFWKSGVRQLPKWYANP